MNEVAAKKIRMQLGTEDVFHNLFGDPFTPFLPINTNLNLDANLGINSNSLSNYQRDVRQEELAKDTEKKKGGDFFGKMFGIINQGLNTAKNLDETIDAFNNSATESNGVNVNPSLGNNYQEQPNMTKYYVIGGVLVAAIIVGVIVTRKK